GGRRCRRGHDVHDETGGAAELQNTDALGRGQSDAITQDALEIPELGDLPHSGKTGFLIIGDSLNIGIAKDELDAGTAVKRDRLTAGILHERRRFLPGKVVRRNATADVEDQPDKAGRLGTMRDQTPGAQARTSAWSAAATA